MTIHHILKQMTLAEKAGQLTQLPPHLFIQTTSDDIMGNVHDLGLNDTQVFLVGSVLGIKNATEMMAIQKRYLEKSRLHIPLLFMADVIHGYETIFPIPLAISCSWNESLAHLTARISAKEASAAGIHMTFAPMADLTRDPRWGRIMEGFGEDSFLTSRFVQAMVKGFQTDSLSNKDSLASCVKHYAGYGAAEAGRDYNTVDMSKLSFYSQYVQGYVAGINASAKGMMASFNTFDGIPVTVNKDLMVDVLRNQLGFKGITITDYDGLNQVIAHGAAEDTRDAAIKALNAKIDIEMASTCYINNIEELVKQGKIDIKVIDEAVLRILSLKEELGLFKNPYRFANPEKEASLVLSKEHLLATKRVALESAVLLKNNGILPLAKTDKIVIMGPYAKSTGTNGAWDWHGDNAKNVSLVDAVIELAPQTKYIDSINTLQNIDASVVIYVYGEDQYETGEAKSKVSLRIKPSDIETIKQLTELGYKVVSVLYNGRPLILEEILDSDAIVEGWFLGSCAAEALTELLFGIVNFSGKLTCSFPRHEGQIPLYYNHLSTGRPYNKEQSDPYTSFYIDCENSPLYPFGYGLSYSTFTYTNLRLSKTEIYNDEILDVYVDVSNTSTIDGYEIVQLYIHDLKATIARPIKELKKFKKIWIKALSTVQIHFEIHTSILTYTTSQNTQELETGDIKIMLGPNSQQLIEASVLYHNKEE